jgi:hypothetical protein
MSHTGEVFTVSLGMGGTGYLGTSGRDDILYDEIKIDATERFGSGTPDTPAGPPTEAAELAGAEVRVRQDPDADSAYGLRLTLDHTGAGSPTPGALCDSSAPDENPLRYESSPGHDTFLLRLKWAGGSGGATAQAELSDGTTLAVRVEIDADGTVRDFGTWTGPGGDVHTDEAIPGAGPVDLGSSPLSCLPVSVDVAGSQITRNGLKVNQSTFRLSAVTIVSTSYSVSGGLELDNRQADVAPDTDPVGTLQLFARDTGAETVMRTATVAVEQDDLTDSIKLQVAGTVLTARRKGVLVWTVDTADEAVIALATGEPALGGTDASGTGAYLELRDFRVEAATEVPIPCEGPPDNPYPGDPPPRPPPMLSTALYPRARARWRPVLGPALTALDLVQPRYLGARRETFAAYVRHRTRWLVSAATETEEGEFLPPETPLPPYFDPCAENPEYPPVDPGDLVPLTDRYYGVSGMPVSMLGSVFTGTTLAIGEWLRQDLPAALLKGVQVVSGMGGRAPYLLGGRYVRDHLLDAVLAKIGALYTFLVDQQGLGSYVGHRFLDDFESRALWPPDGIPDADIAFMFGVLTATYPDIRHGIRGRPTQFLVSPGAGFFVAQEKLWADDPFSFGHDEYQRAQSFGSLISLDNNYGAGGLGDSGVRFNDGTMLSGHYIMSAGEVDSSIAGLLAGAQSVDPDVPLLIGGTGYTYAPLVMTTVGPAGWTAGHNRFAALPPL